MGDVALMLPKERFILGLVAFLVGHLLFAIGFIVRADSAAWWAAVVMAIVAVVSLIFTSRRSIAALAARSSRLLNPVVAYAVVILAMSAASVAGGTLAPLGAATFAASDATLADNKFMSQTRVKSVGVMVSYHAALALLVASLV